MTVLKLATIVLILTTTACATAPAPTRLSCAAMIKQANDSVAAVTACQTIPGCTISLTDLKTVRAEVYAAQRCE